MKKLNRMVFSSVAQMAAASWRRRTVALLGVLMAVHVICFAVLTIEVTNRFENSNTSLTIARALDKMQAIVLR